MSQPYPSHAAASSEDYQGQTGEVSGWAGWVIFAAIMLMLLGFFQAIEGLVALFKKDYFLVGSNGLVVNVDYTTWGWVHLILGILAVLAGAGLLTGNIVARSLGVILAVISAVLNLAFIAAYPLWSVIVIILDVIIIYAIIVHGRELKSA